MFPGLPCARAALHIRQSVTGHHPVQKCREQRSTLACSDVCPMYMRGGLGMARPHVPQPNIMEVGPCSLPWTYHSPCLTNIMRSNRAIGRAAKTTLPVTGNEDLVQQPVESHRHGQERRHFLHDLRKTLPVLQTPRIHEGGGHPEEHEHDHAAAPSPAHRHRPFGVPGERADRNAEPERGLATIVRVAAVRPQALPTSLRTMLRLKMLGRPRMRSSLPEAPQLRVRRPVGEHGGH
mmetsp:Transcript_75364/g.245121  ORF Transcript_75364/g.245121 Transcript_75364/m.245121 type:complete len:235 (-) Transcript_75364:633-1337(-)